MATGEEDNNKETSETSKFDISDNLIKRMYFAVEIDESQWPARSCKRGKALGGAKEPPNVTKTGISF